MEECRDRKYSTYELLRVLGREAHLVTGLGLVVEVGPSLQEAEDGVEEGVETARHVHHLEELAIDVRLQLWVH